MLNHGLIVLEAHVPVLVSWQPRRTFCRRPQPGFGRPKKYFSSDHVKLLDYMNGKIHTGKGCSVVQ